VNSKSELWNEEGDIVLENEDPKRNYGILTESMDEYFFLNYFSF
jgi:hypothetical protein